MSNTAMQIPFDPKATSFPSRKNLPKIPGAPDQAAWVWGSDDSLGRLNLLTPERVKAAAAYIQTGEMARLDLPLNVPVQPAFGRLKFEHKVQTIVEGIIYDDIYNNFNTQGSTQWDGFRHFAVRESKLFYNGATSADFEGEKNSIHHWSDHGFSGRAVFLDYRAYAESIGLTYDTASPHGISWEDLRACGEFQGLDIRPASQGGDIQIGDILLIRSGWVADYYKLSHDKRVEFALRGQHGHHGEQQWVGVKPEEPMLDWLHDCYFAAVAGDAPAFEQTPGEADYALHEYILARWGMPIGEMLDLEKVSQLAKKHNRYFFFFSSAPVNCPRGIASQVNATAIF